MIDITGLALEDAVKALTDALNGLSDKVDALPTVSGTSTAPATDLSVLAMTKIDRLEKEVFDAADIAKFPENVVTPAA